MRIFGIIFLLISIQITGYAQNAGITLQMKNATIEAVMKEIEKQTEYRFFYDAGLIKVSDVVDVSWDFKPMNEALNELFTGKGISHRLIDLQIVLNIKEAESQQKIASQVVFGQITDAADGTPIPLANIYVANTSIGTSSDENGNYSIILPIQGSFEVVVSHVGYKHVFHKVDIPNPVHQINVVMEINEMPEISVEVNRKVKRSDINLFWRRLLGVNPSRNGLEVLNPEKVYFYQFNDDVLNASCSEPIEIVNHQMGYHISYILEGFRHNYRKNETIFDGKPYFKELTPKNNRQKERWEKKRQDIYDVSLTKFFRALYKKDIYEAGFLLFNAGFTFDYLVKAGMRAQHAYSMRLMFTPVSLENFIQADPEKVQVTIESPLLLVNMLKPVTAEMIDTFHQSVWKEQFPKVILLPQQITIYSDGSIMGLLNIQEFDKSSLHGLSSMLPVEYQEKFKY